jgi:hypothetical protein
VLERALADPDAISQIDSGKLAEPYWYTASPLTTRGPPLLFGSSLVLLTEQRPTAAAAARAALTATPAPVTSYALGAIDPGGGLRAALHASADSVHIVRPDGHLAAVLPEFDPGTLTAALRRAIRAAPPA